MFVSFIIGFVGALAGALAGATVVVRHFHRQVTDQTPAIQAAPMTPVAVDQRYTKATDFSVIAHSRQAHELDAGDAGWVFPLSISMKGTDRRVPPTTNLFGYPTSKFDVLLGRTPSGWVIVEGSEPLVARVS
jgi:hypothetical protein